MIQGSFALLHVCQKQIPLGKETFGKIGHHMTTILGIIRDWPWFKGFAPNETFGRHLKDLLVSVCRHVVHVRSVIPHGVVLQHVVYQLLGIGLDLGINQRLMWLGQSEQPRAQQLDTETLAEVIKLTRVLADVSSLCDVDLTF